MLLQVLNIQQEKSSWLSDAIRWVFWFIAKGVLILLDGLFEVINDIWKFKFFNNSYVTKIYSAAIIVAGTWLVLRVILEIIMRYYINQDDNSSPTRIFKGIIFSIAMMFLIPYLFNWGYSLSYNMTQYVISASSNASYSPASMEATMSSMILTAFADNSKMKKADQKEFIETWFSADYNKTDGGKYKYSFHTFSILIVGLVVVVLLFFIGIQVAKRVIELALYKAIAPFVCTTLISNRSHTFEVWSKGVMGTFLVTTVQYLCIGIMFNVFGSVIQNTHYPLSPVLITIGALLFIISSPQLISALLNANTGAMANMNELHSMAALGTSMIAMSKYGSTTDNSTSLNSSNDNSTSNNDDTPPNDNSNMSSNSSSSNLGNTQSANSNSSNNDNSFTGNSDEHIPDFASDNINFDDSLSGSNFTSLADRLDTYKDMSDNNLSFNNSNLYKTNSDWGNNYVSNTKKY